MQEIHSYSTPRLAVSNRKWPKPPVDFRDICLQTDTFALGPPTPRDLLHKPQSRVDLAILLVGHLAHDGPKRLGPSKPERNVEISAPLYIEERVRARKSKLPSSESSNPPKNLLRRSDLAAFGL